MAAGLCRGVPHLRRAHAVDRAGGVEPCAARAAVAMAEANTPIDTIRKALGVGWNTVTRAVLAAAELVAKVSPTRVGVTRR